VIKRFVVVVATGLFILSAHVLGYGDQTQRRAVHPPAAAESTASNGQLIDLLRAQNTARAAGDPASIAASTRTLVAYLLRAAAKLSLLEHKNADALALYRQSLTLVDEPQTHMELGTALLTDGHAADAVSEAQAILAIDPSNLAALRIEGIAYRSLGDDEKARTTFERALRIDPDVNVAYALGSTLLALHDKAKADALFQQILAKTDNAAIWHVAVGDAYRQALYYDEAVAQFKQAIDINPKVGHAEFFLGYTYLQMNQWGPSSQSFQHLREAVRLAPHEFLSNFYLGALESTDGTDLASSNRHLHAAADADPTKPEVWLYLGLNAVREKAAVAAEVYLRKAVALTGNDEAQNNYQIRRVYAVLGRLLVAKGDRVEGDALLQKYKRTEQMSLQSSSAAIGATAHDGMKESHLSDLPVPAVAFPGSVSASSNDPLIGSSQPQSGEIVSMKLTPEQVKSEKELDTLLASSLNDLGTAEARMGNFGPAYDHFYAAEQWGTPTPMLLHNAAVAAFRVNRFDESAQALEAFLKVEPAAERGSAAGARSRMMLAMSRFSMGQFAKADDAFSSIPQAAMQDPRAAYAWAFSLARTGKQQQANKIADALVAQDLPAENLSLVCHVYVDTENYAQSIPCYQKAYREYPELKLAHYQVAEALIHLDRPQEAVAELRQELLLSPEDANVQYALAYALLQSSQKDDAVALLKKIVTEHPEQAEAQYQLGKVELEGGDAAGAVDHLEAAEKADASQAYVHYQLQAAYRKLGRVGDADREAKIYKDMKAAKREIPAERK
jgi:tetratricopeptide (TPR) repeat protein